MKFNVTLSRTVTIVQKRLAPIEVEAENEHEARSIAMKQSEALGMTDPNWEWVEDEPINDWFLNALSVAELVA